MNHPGKMPLCMYPSTIPCVDDEKAFLTHLAVELGLGQSRYLLRLRPPELLQMVNAQTSLPAINPATEIYNAQRFERVSVVVSDFQMPDMNGLQFCDRIQPRGIRKIIVSSKLPSQEALQAINEGQLRGFLNKKDEEVQSQLQKLIDRSVVEYFCEVSGTFQEAGDKAKSALQDPLFLRWFRTLCRQLQVQEHYTVDAAGTFLLVTHKREVMGLYVRTHSQLQQLARDAAGQGCPHAIVHSLEQAQCVLIPPDPAQQKLTQDLSWWRCVHPVSHIVLEGRERYYCAWGAGMFDVDNSKITSFYQYQEQHPD
ncbi:MAG: response regulator [Myxococcota bacterium]